MKIKIALLACSTVLLCGILLSWIRSYSRFDSYSDFVFEKQNYFQLLSVAGGVQLGIVHDVPKSNLSVDWAGVGWMSAPLPEKSNFDHWLVMRGAVVPQRLYSMAGVKVLVGKQSSAVSFTVRIPYAILGLFPACVSGWLLCRHRTAKHGRHVLQL